MSRRTYDPVTIPVLIPCSPGEYGTRAGFLPRSRKVRILSLDELNPRTSEGEKMWRSLNGAERERFIALAAFRRAAEARDRPAMEKACERLALGISPAPERAPISERVVTQWLRTTPLSKVQAAVRKSVAEGNGVARLLLALVKAVRTEATQPHRLISREMSRMLFGVRLVLWWDGKRFLPALYCHDLRSALYVRAMLGIAGGRAIAVCPKCGKPFLQDRSDQDYCSIVHREAHRVARWRAAKKVGSRSAVKRKSQQGT